LNEEFAPKNLLMHAGTYAGATPRAHGLAPATTKIPRSIERPDVRTGIVFNGRAHRNISRPDAVDLASSRVLQAAPASKAELDSTLARFAAEKVDTLVINGGDGTVRDVLGLAPRHFKDGMPTLAIVPSGKTNALAIDLGLPKDWSASDALALIGHGRIERRAPVEISYGGEAHAELRGFLFGAGAFVRATALAQDMHRFGAFNGFAIGLTLAGVLMQTMFATRRNSWRRGEQMHIVLADGREADHPFYLLLGSTLESMPLGIKPFGHVRKGMKLLGVNAPPRWLPITMPAVLTGSESDWLTAQGYKRADTEEFRLRLESDFILDGEIFPGGELTVRQGEPLNFLVPAE
jgi:hypothetical protein